MLYPFLAKLAQNTMDSGAGWEALSRPEGASPSIFTALYRAVLAGALCSNDPVCDAHREVIALVAAELCRPGLKPTGLDGLPAEAIPA